MDTESKKELGAIAHELRGIRKSLEFIAMLEAFREGIPFAEEDKGKTDSKPHSSESRIQFMFDEFGQDR